LIDDPAYWQAVGHLIEAFSSTEVTLLHYLIALTGMRHHVGLAVFSGTRSDQLMSFTRRILAVTPPREEISREIEFAFTQFALIANMRNDIVHHPSVVTNDKGRIAWNVTRAHIPDKIREPQVSAELIDSMIADLNKISLHLVGFLSQGNLSFEERARQVSVLTDAWRYTPPQPGRKQRESRRFDPSPPKPRARPPRSSLK
jgi:hypothetical protein